MTNEQLALLLLLIVERFDREIDCMNEEMDKDTPNLELIGMHLDALKIYLTRLRVHASQLTTPAR